MGRAPCRRGEVTGCLILTAGEPDAATLRLKSERRFGPSPAIRSKTPVVVTGSSFTRGRSRDGRCSRGVCPSRCPSSLVAAVGVCGWAARQDCVVDGDTIWYGGLKIRLADIDAPEISEPKCASEATLGHRAKRRLFELINSGPIEIVRTGRDEDRYGRKLRVVMQNGRSLGEILVAEGLARRWDGARRSWCDAS